MFNNLLTIIAALSWVSSILVFLVVLYIAAVLTALVQAVREFKEQEAEWLPPNDNLPTSKMPSVDEYGNIIEYE